MSTVNLPQKCLEDAGRGRSWLLTTLAHFGGQEAIDEAETAVRTAMLKGITWRQILAAVMPHMPELFKGKMKATAIAETINMMPAPVPKEELVAAE